MKTIPVPLTCDGSGNASVALDAQLGKLFAVVYQPGTIATGATLTVTCSNGTTTRTLLSKANAGTSNVTFYPRDLVNASADGAALTGTAGGDRCLPLVLGKLTVAIASGGNGGAGSAICVVE